MHFKSLSSFLTKIFPLKFQFNLNSYLLLFAWFARKVASVPELDFCLHEDARRFQLENCQFL